MTRQSPAGRHEGKPSTDAWRRSPIPAVSSATGAKRTGPAAQVALIAALVVGLIGVSLVLVLVVGLLDGVRGLGPVLLAVLAVGVFALAARLLMVSRSLRTRAVRRGPRPRPRREGRTPAL